MQLKYISHERAKGTIMDYILTVEDVTPPSIFKKFFNLVNEHLFKIKPEPVVPRIKKYIGKIVWRDASDFSRVSLWLEYYLEDILNRAEARKTFEQNNK